MYSLTPSTSEKNFQSLVTNRRQLVIIVQLLFSSNTLAMSTRLPIKGRPDQVHKEQCIYFRRFQTHLLVAVHQSARIHHEIDLDFVF